MRETKFRAWDKERKKMYVVDNIDFRKELINVFEPEDIRSYCAGNIERPFKSIILIQFTGLKDKNGKEVYRFDFYKRSDGQIACIKNFIEDTYHLIQWVRDGGTFEIIGNKFSVGEVESVPS